MICVHQQLLSWTLWPSWEQGKGWLFPKTALRPWKSSQGWLTPRWRKGSEGITSTVEDESPADLQVYVGEFFHSLPRPNPNSRTSSQRFAPASLSSTSWDSFPSPNPDVSYHLWCPGEGWMTVKSGSESVSSNLPFIPGTWVPFYLPSSWRTVKEKEITHHPNVIPPPEPRQHRVLRCGWVRGPMGAQNSCQGKSDEIRKRRFRIMIFKLLFPSPCGLSQALCGSLGPAISCLAYSIQACRDCDHTVTQD